MLEFLLYFDEQRAYFLSFIKIAFIEPLNCKSEKLAHVG